MEFIRRRGHVSWRSVDARLRAASTIWIATAGGHGPHAAAVWFVWDGRHVVFSTPSTSHKARDLSRDPRAQLHLESGDDVVLLRGRVATLTDDDLASAEADYGEKYVDPVGGAHADFSTAGDRVIAVDVLRISAWLGGVVDTRTDWVRR